MNRNKVYLYSAFFVILAIIVSTFIPSCKKLEIERVVKIKTGEISDITPNSAVVSGVIEDIGESGVSQHGHCWSVSEYPTATLSTRSELGPRKNIGSFSSNITDIVPGTMYYIRAYAISDGIFSYGDNASFTTSYQALPAVSTKLPENITTHSAVCGGEVTDDGGEPVTERGICWSISENPTLMNDHTTEGSGMGEFSSMIEGLSYNTTYYIRAYATNRNGTAYGEEIFFTTKDAVSIIWQITLGGSAWEWAVSVQQRADGGFIFTGGTGSNDGDISGNHGGYDYWVVKLNSPEEIEWQKLFGGSNLEFTHFMQQTTDGGYILSGSSRSDDGDVSGNNGNYDYWIVKLTSAGEIDWEKPLGGSESEWPYAITQTIDEGFIVAGFSRSNDGDVSGNHGEADYWIVKLTPSGEIDWQKSLGGNGSEYAQSIQQTTDEGFIVAGFSSSNDGDVSGNHGDFDYWIVKLTPLGEIDWQKSLGGSGSDTAHCIQQTNDGGYVIAGSSGSNDGDISGNHGESDYWIVKLNPSGEIDWERSIGGSGFDHANSIQQTNDGGYIIAGRSNSVNGDVTGNHGGSNDFWIVKLNASGEIQWQKSFGGYNFDQALSVRQTTDGGYIIGGETRSGDGDVPGNKGEYDAWVIRLVEN